MAIAKKANGIKILGYRIMVRDTCIIVKCNIDNLMRMMGQQVRQEDGPEKFINKKNRSAFAKQFFKRYKY